MIDWAEAIVGVALALLIVILCAVAMTVIGEPHQAKQIVYISPT